VYLKQYLGYVWQVSGGHFGKSQPKSYPESNTWRPDNVGIRLIDPKNQTKSIIGSRLSRNVILCNWNSSDNVIELCEYLWH